MTPQAIAHYSITAKLGDDGMGEMCGAIDSGLGARGGAELAGGVETLGA